MRFRLPHRQPRDERGAVAIMMAVLSVVLFVIAALVVDLGLARDTQRQSQISADASALAAANVLFPADGDCADPGDIDGQACLLTAAGAAKSYAAVNFGVTEVDWASCTDGSALTVQDGATPCISFDDPHHPQQVRVAMPTRTVNTGLGVLADVREIDIATDAGAGVGGGPPRSCGLCVLGGVSTNNTDFSVSPGSILVNGSIAAASNSVWQAGGDILVAGSSVSSKAQFLPAWGPTHPIEDPYADRLLPSPTGSTKSKPCATKPKKGPTVPGDGPGDYGTVTISGDCELSPGTYVVTGKWTLGNKDVLSGTGVTLFVTSTGELDFKNGYAEFSAPTTGATSGLAVVYARDNTRELGLQGNGLTNITGAIYAKSSTLNLNGNSCFNMQGGPIIVGGISAVGNKSCINVTNSHDAPVAAVPGDSYLAE